MSRAICPADHPVVWAKGQAASLAACEDHAGTWGELVAWATAEPARSPETMAEYAALPGEERQRLKRADWIVGGPVAGGHRMAAAVPVRTILTVDVDECSPEALSDLEFQRGWPRGWAYCGHTTRSSTPEAPRVRLYLPLAEPLPAAEHRLAALGLVAMLEAASVDEHGVQHLTADRAATADAARLMYGPTLCSDAPHVAIVSEGTFPDVTVLVAAGRAADVQGAPTAAREAPRAPRQAWDDDDIDRHGIEALRACGVPLWQSPRRATELTTVCPWHDDKNPSLDIATDGRMVCRAGCRTDSGEPITWLRLLSRIRGISEAEAFRAAREAVGLPARVTAPAPVPHQFEDVPEDDPSPLGRWGLTPLSQIPRRVVSPDDRLWGEVITRGCVTLLSGSPGIGKSTLIRHAIAAIAEGHGYLGMPGRGRKAVVVVVDYETPDVFRDSFWRDVYGDDIAGIDHVYLADTLPPVNHAAHALIEETRRVGADLVVIDTVSAGFLIENENDNSEMQKVAAVLRQVAASGPAVLAIAHPSKGGADVRGASALPAAIETVLTYRTAKAMEPGAPIDETTDFVLTVRKNRVGDQGATRIVWDGRGGFEAPDVASPAELLEADRIVLEIVVGYRPGTISITDLKRLAALERVANRTAFVALRRLVANGLVTKRGRGVYG